ncbi:MULTISPECIES: hypothetical protein [unclassified Bradyrhizobium]|uniref:hypothetical protein n=1 Tax=unclassified Bradyrhizobium TaxID=2631580 RepID=UPI001CD78D10|nr:MULTISPECIES: hypothetical protein [unclassified Bradyrhizobium]MCA1384244.1 hypothetical protein [Bradyrhizobium sp. BRP05]MCA1393567.1 hypothetical protein [Bradyrhizobium sp. IC3123]MCA1420986.1 hypothetical protein [Bradyrhizobium sp. BRP23]MCA1430713.1 hypothetical protein [Bradyrhizobium sp. NBAIM16]MCA1479912.1 hypothetical protein [Bradyrhizobium sp. NBAIM08]
MIDRLLHWRWCFGEHAAVKLVNDAQVHVTRFGAPSGVRGGESRQRGAWEKGLM